jgi:anaerobic sulfite reductase subunit B
VDCNCGDAFASSCHEGFVTDCIKELPLKDFGDNYAVLVVGPAEMMNATGKELVNAGYKEDRIWMSFERRMSCAIGKCGHCRIDEVYVCTDGPVFPYSVAKALVD